MAEKIGLEAIFSTEQFTAASKKYAALNKEIVSITMSTAAATSKAGIMLAVGLGTALGNIAVGAGRAFIGMLDAAIDKLKDLGSEIVAAASRVGELDAILRALGALWGIQQEEIDATVKSMEDANIQMDIARSTIAEFIRGQWDLTKATQLATAARDLATISGMETSEALRRLTYGIRTLNTRMLRNAGAAVNLQMEYARYRKETGKVAGSLTSLEKQEIALNAVLREGARVQGAYWAAMQEGSKVARSTKRALYDLMVLIGTPFKEAYWRLTQAQYDFVMGMQSAVKEGGKLYDSLRKWGALFAVIGEAIQDVASKALPWLIDETKKFSDTMWDLAFEALEWGVNIAVNIADGLIQGANIAITAALNFIGDILAGWLAPGSPPKIAPGLVAWGMAAMQEWLYGMTLANFDILKTVQSSLDRIFRIFEATGRLGADKIGAIFRDVSGEIMKAFAGVGKLGKEVFDKIRKVTGEFADDIIKLIHNYEDLQGAIQRVEDAQERLNQATETQVEQEETVRRLVDEYNAMMRAGAGRAVLQTKLAELNVAERQLEVTRQQRVEAEKAVEDAEKAVAPLEEQFKIQQSILAQLVRIAEALIPPKERAAREKKKKEEWEIPPIVLPTPDTGAFRKKIDEAFEALKKSIREKLMKAFEPIMTKWEKDWKGQVKDIEKKLKEIKRIFVKIWNAIRVWYVTKFLKWWRTVSKSVGTIFTDTWDAIKKWWNKTLVPWMRDTVIAGWQTFVDKFKDDWGPAIDTFFKRFEDDWKPLIDAFVDITLKKLDEQMDQVGKTASAVESAYKRWVEYLGQEHVKQTLKDFGGWIDKYILVGLGGLVNRILGLGGIPGVIPALQAFMEWLAGDSPLSQAIRDWVLVSGFELLLKQWELLAKLLESIPDLMESIRDWLRENPGWWHGAWPRQPEDGGNGDGPPIGFQQQGPGRMQPSYTTYTNTIEINLGGVTIANEMDYQTLAARLRQDIAEAI